MKKNTKNKYIQERNNKLVKLTISSVILEKNKIAVPNPEYSYKTYKMFNISKQKSYQMIAFLFKKTIF